MGGVGGPRHLPPAERPVGSAVAGGGGGGGSGGAPTSPDDVVECPPGRRRCRVMRRPGGVRGSRRSGHHDVAIVVSVNLLVGSVETSLPFFWFSKLVQFV